MNTDHPKETEEPRATRVSMFGARWARDLKPEMKNALLMIITTMASSICTMPRPMWLWFKNAGTGQEAMLWPMVMYMRSRRNTRELTRRRTSFGVSRSFSASSSAASFALALSFCEVCAPFGWAPYPAFSTALMMSEGFASPSTAIELVKSDTETLLTPGTLATAFSTWAWHEAQVMPVTIY